MTRPDSWERRCSFSRSSRAQHSVHEEQRQRGHDRMSGTGIRVSHIDLGRSVSADKTISGSTDSFKPNDTIYASIATEGSAPTAALKARWTYQGGQVVNESTQTIAATGDARTEFHVSKPDGWPAGKYKLEVLVNGSSAATKDFEVAP